MNVPLTELVAPAAAVMRQAGQAIMGYFRQQFTQREKSLGDFVTAADLASQELLVAGLTPLVPQAQIVAEEQADDPNHQLQSLPNSAYAWVIDPLDGTNNFRHGVPRFAISVALTYQRQAVLGLIYDPVLQELFYAVKGQGLYGCQDGLIEKRRSRVTPSAPASLHNCLITTNMPELITWAALAQEGALWRKLGCAALDLAYVAQGWVDLAAYDGLYWWDWAAGALLVQEAQLQFEQMAAPNGWGGGQRVLAGSPALVQRVLTQLS